MMYIIMLINLKLKDNAIIIKGSVFFLICCSFIELQDTSKAKKKKGGTK